MAEYCGNEPFIIKIKEMAKKYNGYRKTRRDGSCFYRAFLFRAFEVILIEKNENYKNKLLQKLKEAKEFLKKAGFEGFVYEDIQQLFI
jgi:ubiquitin thioesterase protein OTUB1